jgi:replicative DNA helicase
MLQSNKIAPSNFDAEEAVNGSLLIDGKSFRQLMGEIEADDFFSEANRWIFIACKDLTGADVAINEITVAYELEKKGRLVKCGGNAYLNHLVSITPTSLDIVYYARIVRETSNQRQIITIAEKISSLAFEGGPVDETIRAADDMLLKIRLKANTLDIITPGMRLDILNDRYNSLQEKSIAMSTGMAVLDANLSGGFYPGELIIVAARTGMGKTEFIQTLSNRESLYNDILFVSVEMDLGGLSDRDVAGTAEIPLSVVRIGGYSENIRAKIELAVAKITGENRIFFYEGQNITTEAIYRAGLEMQARRQLGAIFVDYLAILDDEYGDNEVLRLGYITRKLKKIARSLGVPVIAVHQLNRDVDKRDDKRPVLSDLRASGSVEQDADIVLFLYRQSYYDKSITDGSAAIIIAKDRQGEAGYEIPVMYDKGMSRQYYGLDEWNRLRLSRAEKDRQSNLDNLGERVDQDG